MGKLTAAIVKALAAPGRYGDGGTLFLNIAPGGSKSWIQRVTMMVAAVTSGWAAGLSCPSRRPATAPSPTG